MRTSFTFLRLCLCAAVAAFCCAGAWAGPLSVVPAQVPFTALENSGTQTGFIELRNTSGSLVQVIGLSLRATPIPTAGEVDDMATNVVLVAPHPTLNTPLLIPAGGSANIRFTWDPVDLILAPGAPDFGQWATGLFVSLPSNTGGGTIGGALGGLHSTTISFLVYDAGYNLPEPGALAMVALGLVGWAALSRRRLRART